MRIIPEAWGVIDESTVLIDLSTMTEVNLPIVDRQIDTNLNLAVGRRYRSEYVPSELYRVDQNGNNMIREKIRINTYFLSVYGAKELKMTKSGAGRQDRTEIFTSTIDFEDENLFHNMFNGEVPFYFKDFTTDAKATFWTDHYLGCEIDMISYTGQFWEYAGGM
jgi:hypothetical protein